MHTGLVVAITAICCFILGAIITYYSFTSALNKLLKNPGTLEKWIKMKAMQKELRDL